MRNRILVPLSAVMIVVTAMAAAPPLLAGQQPPAIVQIRATEFETSQPQSSAR